MGVIEKVVKLLGISGFINIVDKKGEMNMCAFDESKYLERFKNHVATFTDYDNIKILDFKNPKSSDYRIRFLFEEDYCRLHISGDLGELTACNYDNMCLNGFGDFVNNTEYFQEKVLCHNRAFHDYDEELAREQVVKHIEEYLNLSDFENYYDWQSDEENMNDILDSIFNDFTVENGIGEKGLDVLYEVSSDAVYELRDAGQQDTGILELYMTAFKLAMEQLKEK